MDPLGVALRAALGREHARCSCSCRGASAWTCRPSSAASFVCLGACILGFAVCPGYFASGALQAGIWKYGLVLGAFGLLIPVVLFGIGTPHLPAGLSAIMASSELPCGILISVFVLGEPVSTLQAAGVVVILAGVVVSQLPNLLRPRPAFRKMPDNRAWSTGGFRGRPSIA